MKDNTVSKEEPKYGLQLPVFVRCACPCGNWILAFNTEVPEWREGSSHAKGKYLHGLRCHPRYTNITHASRLPTPITESDGVTPSKFEIRRDELTDVRLDYEELKYPTRKLTSYEYILTDSYKGKYVIANYMDKHTTFYFMTRYAELMCEIKEYHNTRKKYTDAGGNAGGGVAGDGGMAGGGGVAGGGVGRAAVHIAGRI